MKSSKIKDIAKNVIRIEAKAVGLMENRIDNSFENAVQKIIDCNGRVICSGIGKSGLISQKIAATMSSTGTPAYFVHPAEATHGDLGMIANDDILIIVSNSGETSELMQIIPSIKKKSITIIGLIGRKNSTLAFESDIYLDASVDKEACTLDLAPTASTTATLAMGDALAISLLELKGFGREDFALLHPGGILGKRLLLTIEKLTHKGEEIPFIYGHDSVKNALFKISDKGLGLTGVLDKDDNLTGIITDGDIRRGLENLGDDILNETAENLMTREPKTVPSNTLAISALELMEKHSITSLFVYSSIKLKKPDGVIHIHDILSLGI